MNFLRGIGMTRKFLVQLSPIMIFVFMLAACFGFVTNEAGASPAPSVMKIDTVDGQVYSPTIHKKIVAFIIYRNAVNGNQVLGFSTIEKYKAHQQQNLSQPNIQTADARNYFYEHTSFDNRGLGAYISLAVGNNYYYVGDSWNDRISSFDLYPSSSITLYQHWHYEGHYITFVNNGNNYWFQNLTNYEMPDGTNWNDQVSSITSRW
jgi:hypothetical protein